MMIKLVLSGAAGLAAIALATAPASANSRQSRSEGKPSAGATPTASPSANQKRYCVVDTMTGTRIRTRECKTREEWIREDNFDPLDR